MESKLEADRDELINLLTTVALASKIESTDATLSDLVDSETSTLRKALGEGIVPNDLVIRILTFVPIKESKSSRLVVAANSNAESDYYACYIVQGSRLVASYEN
jgi:hypothetical protein